MRYLLATVFFTVLFIQAPALAANPKPVKAKSPPTQASLDFYSATAGNNLDMMPILLKRGADINCDNCSIRSHSICNDACIRKERYTPLMKKAASVDEYYRITNVQIIQFLVENGADVNRQNSDGITALMLASSAKSPSKVKLLVESGANVALKDRGGRDALAYVVDPDADYLIFAPPYIPSTNFEQYEFLIKYLVENGASINGQDEYGISPLMLVAGSCGRTWAYFPVELTKLLLSLGADPNLKSKAGKSALMIAEKIAVKTSQGSTCNSVYLALSNSASSASVKGVTPDKSGATTDTVSASNQAPVDPVASLKKFNAYEGRYAGSYNGDDNGAFQITIEQDGTIKLNGKSQINNHAFTGVGKMNSDGSLGITLGSVSTGATFQGSINPKTGGVYGTWRNGEEAGNFSGSKQTGQTQAAENNPIESIGGLLNVLNKALVR